MQAAADFDRGAIDLGTAEALTRRLGALLDQRGGPPDAAANLQPVLAKLAQQAESPQAEAQRLPVWQIAGEAQPVQFATHSQHCHQPAGMSSFPTRLGQRLV